MPEGIRAAIKLIGFVIVIALSTSLVGCVSKSTGEKLEAVNLETSTMPVFDAYSAIRQSALISKEGLRALDVDQMKLRRLSALNYYKEAVSSSENPTVVSTAQGLIQGLEENDLLVFKGVPFAKPPIGELRFAPPQLLDSWEGILECTEFAPAAMQQKGSEVVGSEDCLYLNIWTPLNTQNERLPVYVYIHGGAFATGSASEGLHDDGSLAREGIIQVNISYRLNGLGFLALEEIENKYGYLGNAGILDQIAALKWIKENIEYFGGDSENITIGGESAGAFSASDLVLSPLASDLFNKAIMESGNLLGQPLGFPQQPGDRDTAIASTKDFMRSLGVDSVSDLKQLNAKDIVSASTFNGNMIEASPYYFWPIFDGVVIPENPYTALVEGKVNSVDVLVGYNTDEGSLFIPKEVSEMDYRAYVETIFGSNAQKVFERYPVSEQFSESDLARYYIKMSFRFGSDVLADELSEKGQKAYFYHFNFTTDEYQESGIGAAHGLELYFIFDKAELIGALSKEQVAFKNKMRNYWVNFIKTGNPNGKTALYEPTSANVWLPYTETTKHQMILNEYLESSVVEDADEVEFFRSLFWE